MEFQGTYNCNSKINLTWPFDVLLIVSLKTYIKSVLILVVFAFISDGWYQDPWQNTVGALKAPLPRVAVPGTHS